MALVQTIRQCGVVTFVQRFGGAVNLNVHFHSLVLDGVYYLDDRQRLRFRRLPPPGDGEVARVTARIAAASRGCSNGDDNAGLSRTIPVCLHRGSLGNESGKTVIQYPALREIGGPNTRR